MLMASKLFERLCFAWSGDYESLKQFVKDDLNLEGTWSQPGGDRKLFTLGDSTILWKKNKNVLRLDGARANEIMQSLCKLICSFEAPISDDRQPSMQSAAVCDPPTGPVGEFRSDPSFIRNDHSHNICDVAIPELYG